MKTYAPSFTNCFAVARPMPLLPPVMSATLPSSLPMPSSVVVVWALFAVSLCGSEQWILHLILGPLGFGLVRLTTKHAAATTARPAHARGVTSSWGESARPSMTLLYDHYHVD